MRTWNTTFSGRAAATATVLAATLLIPGTAESAHAAGRAPAQAPLQARTQAPARTQAAARADAPAPVRASGRTKAKGRAAGPPALGACATGQLCLWAKPEFKGARTTHELSTLDINSCTALPAGTTAQSLTNRTGRPVTTYQSAECAETGEFQTYPGDGVWLPQSPYQVRAFKVWER
ncbi:peptidase inhibitor family I36 protein [Streptomyces sp. NBC_00335]|uniref:peptidase inhibitor family I36 protein n=1 Tax=unclassified Streptomyces TaxID=2593676 RepID=UPI00224ECB3B|nr:MULTISPECIES: peptidase inhibitor family I36 protein [unclassified Streptomyces]MCX5407425.1 peptidase inhibitor family I36 protein [Streptomyces sp. NBC_00086]